MTDRIPHRVIDALLSSRWAITEDALRGMIEIAHRKVGDVEAIAAKLGRPLENTYTVTVRDGVATIPMDGPLFRRANLFTAISGATSYEMIAQDIAKAVEDPTIIAIIGTISSPGGDAEGCSELASLIKSFRGKKPLKAYIGGQGCSAAYWIASAFDEVVCAKTAIVGCLGVRMTYTDTSKRQQALGIEEIEIVSSQTPKKQMDPTTAEGRSEVQVIVDALAQVFLEDVAANIGVPLAKVLSDFGQGGVLVGQAAVDAGMASRISTFESLQAELSNPRTRGVPGRSTTITTRQETRMAKTTAKGAGAPATAAFAEGAEVTSLVARDVVVGEGAIGTVTAVREGPLYGVDFGGGMYQWLAEDELAANTTEADGTDAGKEARAHKLTDLLAAARLEGATAERTRLAGIDALTTVGLEKLAKDAKADPTVTPELFAKQVLEHEAAARSAHLAGLKADESQIKAPAPPATTPASTEVSRADRVIASYDALNKERAGMARK